MSSTLIIWDYDGTLVDTRMKNLNVTRNIIQSVTGKDPDCFGPLKNLEEYCAANERVKNWKDLYKNEFGFTEELVLETGKLWTQFQLEDQTEVTLFPGLESVLDSLNIYPNIIFSQNSKSNIARFFENSLLQNVFIDIIGYEELPAEAQKPAPDGIFLCIDSLEDEQITKIFFIGDHETDTLCAFNAKTELTKSGSDIQIYSIAATYGLDNNVARWKTEPDYIANSTEDILKIIKEN